MKENILKKLNYLTNIGINNVVYAVLSVLNVFTMIITDRINIKRT